MKHTNLFWIALLLLSLVACNEPDNTVETESMLELDIRVNSIVSENNDSYSFAGSTTFCLANKDNAQNFPNNILSVMLGKGATLILPHINGQFTSLQLDWGYGEIGSEVFDMQNSIELLSSVKSLSNHESAIELDEVLSPVINQIDINPNSYIKIIVSGNANHAVSSIVKMEIPITVEHEVLEVRFTIL